MYLCSKLTSLNYVVIGTEFGNKDRTTVTHNIEKIENEIKDLEMEMERAPIETLKENMKEKYGMSPEKVEELL